MISKNKRSPTVAERAHIERIKSMACRVCGAGMAVDMNKAWPFPDFARAAAAIVDSEGGEA